jgi:hypothetical protein
MLNADESLLLEQDPEDPFKDKLSDSFIRDTELGDVMKESDRDSSIIILAASSFALAFFGKTSFDFSLIFYFLGL